MHSPGRGVSPSMDGTNPTDNSVVYNLLGVR